MRTSGNLREIKPSISGVITLSNSSTINVSDGDFIANSMSFIHGTSSANEFTVGGAVIGECDFGLRNDNGKFDGVDWFDSKISITLTAGNTAVNMGEYLIVSHNENGSNISINSQDRMRLLDEYGIYEDNITYPTTIQNIVSTICSNRGLSYSGLAYPNMTIDDPDDETMTERQCIMYLAQIMGQFAIVKNNVLTFSWYSSTAYDAGVTFNHNFDTKNFVVTGLEVKSNDDEAVETKGDGLIKIGDNPFITQDNIATVANQIWGAINGLTYRGGSCAISSNVAIEAGDRLQVTTGQITTEILVTNVTYKLQVQEEIQSDAPPVSDLRLSKTDQVKKIANKAISNQLKNPNSPLSKAIAEAGGGGDSKWGGPNNTYGIAEAYDDSDNQILQIDKDGVVMTDTNEIETLVKKEVTYKPKSIQNYNLPERIRSNATMGRVTKDIYDIVSHYIAGAITRTQFGPAFADESAATPTNVPSGSASAVNAINKNYSAAYIETDRDRPTDRSYDKVDIKLGRKESTVEHGKSNVRFYGNVVSDNLTILHDSSDPTVEPSDFDNTYVSLLELGGFGAIWLDYLEDELKLVIGQLQDNGKYKPIGYIDITPYEYDD